MDAFYDPNIGKVIFQTKNIRNHNVFRTKEDFSSESVPPGDRPYAKHCCKVGKKMLQQMMLFVSVFVLLDVGV